MKARCLGTEGGYDLCITDQGKARVDIYYGAYYVGLIGNTVLSANTWHHVAGVYNGSQLQVYVDGALDNSLSTSVTITSTSMSLLIGESRYPYNHSYFNGLIDEVRISNAAVYTANFTPQMHLTASSSTKGLWKFDGQTANDSSGNGNNGTLNGGATYSIDVPSGDGGGGGTAPQIHWLVTDQLGTPRMVFDQSGSLATVSRHDYLPFGEEISAGVGGRTTAQGYTLSDNVRQKFASKERDNETGLDYFLARYYSSSQGRFTSPDEFTGGPDELYYFAEDASANPTFYADLRKPQSLNKYQYSFNNPLRYVDPDGHDPEEPEPPQKPKPVIPVPVPVGPGLPLPIPVPIGPAPAGPTDQQIIEGAKSVLDTVCDYTGITKLADWLRPKIMPTPAQPTTATPPSPRVQPVPPPPITMGKGSTKDERKVNQGRAGSAKSGADAARAERDRLRASPNKTPEVKEALRRAERDLQRQIDRMRKSESHGRKPKGNQD